MNLCQTNLFCSLSVNALVNGFGGETVLPSVNNRDLYLVLLIIQQTCVMGSCGAARSLSGCVVSSKDHLLCD